MWKKLYQKKKEKGINSGDSRGDEGECLLEIGEKNLDIVTGIEYMDKDERILTKQVNNLKKVRL